MADGSLPLRGSDREQLRRRMERAVDRLLAALDALDGDADAEPSLGAPMGLDQRRWAQGGDADEREDVSEDEGAQCDGGGAEEGCEDEGAGAFYDVVPDYHPEDQRRVVTGRFGARTFYWDV